MTATPAIVSWGIATVLAVTLAGCGLGAGHTPTAVTLTVTRDFGSRVLTHRGAPRVRGQETVMSLLMRNYGVSTRYGGKFVQSIDGLTGGQESGAPVDWFYFDNGVQASKGAADTVVHPGDAIWWDRHDWSQTEDVPAVVGSFPQPFLTGITGKRLPVRIECDDVGGTACQAVAAHLRGIGVPAAIAGLGVTGGPLTLRVLVGPWSRIGGDAGAREIQAGPRESGIYARFSSDGRSLTALDQRGRALAPMSGDTGLVAATRNAEDAPVWLITGTDARGVELAAEGLRADVLHDRFAAAFHAGAVISLPQVSG